MYTVVPCLSVNLSSEKKTDNLAEFKVIMQGKLIAVANTLRTYIETSSLWAEFVNKKRCISVRLVYGEDKSIKF